MAVQHHTTLPLDQRPPLLRLNHVDKVFSGDVVALRDMTLQVNQGDFISLLGPSQRASHTQHNHQNRREAIL